SPPHWGSATKLLSLSEGALSEKYLHNLSITREMKGSFLLGGSWDVSGRIMGGLKINIPERKS
ncbi:MAG: hypothetical protein Q4D33_03890, partial [Prevotellaceae bacterium]|nr:hypothetical protein [Prevotellaceae bacterium]